MTRGKWVISCLVLGLLFAGTVGSVWLTQKDPYVKQAAPVLPAPPLKELAEQRGLQLGSFAALKYLRERPYREILAGQFEYAIIDGSHLHIAVSDEQGLVTGGHLKEGATVYPTAEVVIYESAGATYTRELDPETGFPELTIEQ